VTDPAPVVDGRAVEAVCESLELSAERLWLDYVGLGGELFPEDVQAWLAGGAGVGVQDHDRLVHAVNERLVAAGREDRLRYLVEVP
jgi:hypothetical protein